MKSLSRLVESVPGSPTTLMMQKGRELAAQGLDVINLAGGEPDFDTPKHIQQAAFDAIAAGDTHYPPPFGKPELLDAICAKLERENNVQAVPEQLLVTPGGKWALYTALASLLNDGDEVMILDPAWVSYAPMVRLNRGVPVHVPLPAADSFRVRAAQLEEHVSEKTKLLMICSPSNPTGRVLTQEELDDIARVWRSGMTCTSSATKSTSTFSTTARATAPSPVCRGWPNAPLSSTASARTTP